MDKLLTTQELAARLGIHSEGVDYLKKTKRIPQPQRLGRTNVWTQEQAQRIMAWWTVRTEINKGCGD